MLSCLARFDVSCLLLRDKVKTRQYFILPYLSASLKIYSSPLLSIFSGQTYKRKHPPDIGHVQAFNQHQLVDSQEHANFIPVI